MVTRNKSAQALHGSFLLDVIQSVELTGDQFFSRTPNTIRLRSALVDTRA